MIDFEKIFEETLSGHPFEPEEESREDRLKRDDQELFGNKRLHEVVATMSMDTVGSRSLFSRVQRASRQGPGGSSESIGLKFEGQRAEDLKQGQLFAEMEAERQERMARNDYSSPERDLDLVGTWEVRTWRDKEGKPRKGFDLVVAAWSFTNKAGERVMEGALPSVPTASKVDERTAAIRAKAEKATQPSARAGSRNDGEIDF